MTDVIYELTGFAVVLLGMLFLQRRLHLEIQAVLVLLFGRLEVALVIFSLLFLPGVVLHEISHLIAAWLLRVKTLRISLIPHPMPDGRLRMGYVETGSTDIFRDSLIGAAPLIAGGAFIAYTSFVRFNLAEYWFRVINGTPGLWLTSIQEIVSRPDFWLWFYLLFVVSSTMFPSHSDRRAWLPLLLIFGLIIAFLLIVGAGEWLRARLTLTILKVLNLQTSLLSISLLIHLLLLLPVYILHRLIIALKGGDIL